MDALLNWLWQGGVVAATSFVMLLALDRARANVRYTVCWATSLLVAALPALALLPPSAASPNLSGATYDGAIVSLPHAWWTSPVVVLAAWILWAGIHLVRVVSAIVALRRARARCRRFPPQLESALPHWCRVRSEGRRATLVLSDSVTAAAVLGSGAPMIAVRPSLVRTLDPDELDRVLIHEWAHVQRRDDVVNILQIVVRMVAGWHPALWWIDRRLHAEREIACDEMTVAITGSPKSYAACLVKLASLKATPRTMRGAPAVVTPSGLGARVVKIVSPRPSIPPAWSRGIAAGVVMTQCVMSVTLAGLTLVEATAFAQPFVAPRMSGTTPDRPAAAARARLSPATAAAHAARQTPLPPPSPGRPNAESPAPAPPPQSEPDARPAPAAALPIEPTRGADAPFEPPVAAAAVSLPGTPVESPVVTPAASRSPWTAAAAGGAAVGRKSKDAGVATAGFFTRFARRVAGSF